MKMKSRAVKAALALSLGALLPGAAIAQTTTGTGMQMPWQGQFWGHFGASIGAGEIGLDAPPGVNRDRRDTVWRVYGGGRFNNAIGGEIGWVDLGTYNYTAPGTPGADVSAEGLDLALIAGVPFANNWNIFGKFGAAYLRSAVGTGIAGLDAGSHRRWGMRYGAGVQMGLAQNWAVRLDLDRYRVRFPGERDNIDTVMLGVQYNFR